jgi:protein-disulfide isomerase
MNLITRRFFGLAGGIAALALSAGAQAQTAAPAAAKAAPVYKEFIHGDKNAKVTVIEYASLTCPHCAAFAQTVWPEVKKNYVDTGKIKFVFRDYPLDGLAMSGALLARCAPDDRGKKMIEMMFKNQLEWVRAPAPIEPLKQYAQLAGMTPADVDACLKNTVMLKTIKDEQEKATSLYKVQSTPTFYVGDEKVDGEMSYAAFAKIIDKQLAKAK